MIHPIHQQGSNQLNRTDKAIALRALVLRAAQYDRSLKIFLDFA